jgi:tol-pal system protein YbgF
MKNLLTAALACSLIACASTSAPDDVDVSRAAAPAADNTQLTQMQTAMTEMLERLDVMNDRLTRMEETRTAEPVAVIAPAPAPVVDRVTEPAVQARATAPSPALSRSVTIQETTPQAAPASRALAGAQVADNYRAALVMYGRGRAREARQAFQDVYDSDPGGELADNALFWIGETYFAAADYNNAMRYYRRVSVDFGDQNKAPDAMYKMGLAQAKTGDLALARRTLQEVIAKYPYSSSAASARQELTRIKY